MIHIDYDDPIIEKSILVELKFNDFDDLETNKTGKVVSCSSWQE